eukprot:CAMPEP_0201533930 /NCGR_PEP_ID=MMETSP0161_2-20130828/54764_1 /ASSEMBLY_ACC=CAM_ASM_000251 /TAXON_ID=180227 /ORGANISM="Neoparamoeba aestuarina, Strain SoJaBio B1-5/56/2" /LENGTH=193 /DNA_ID=CAMNT_0047938279 /DNA_START=95 /DNA_END=673 /DNA_ORIENTATION=+
MRASAREEEQEEEKGEVPSVEIFRPFREEGVELEGRRAKGGGLLEKVGWEEVNSEGEEVPGSWRGEGEQEGGRDVKEGEEGEKEGGEGEGEGVEVEDEEEIEGEEAGEAEPSKRCLFLGDFSFGGFLGDPFPSLPLGGEVKRNNDDNLSPPDPLPLFTWVLPALLPTLPPLPPLPLPPLPPRLAKPRRLPPTP